MKTTILSIVSLVLFVSCKKTYNCECKGYSIQALVVTEHQTVNENSKIKAEESCIKKSIEYGEDYYTEKGIIIMNCDIE